MEVKKSPKADLNNKKLLFVEVGLVLALLVTLGAFEWKTKEKQESVFAQENTELIEEEIIPITQDTPPPPPETPKIPILSDQIDIVDDNIKVDDNILNLEDDSNLGVEIMDYVEEVQEEVVEEEAIPFALVEEKPKFQGGDANNFSKWVASHLEYPEIAKENGVSGRVMVQFTVNHNGTVRREGPPWCGSFPRQGGCPRDPELPEVDPRQAARPRRQGHLSVPCDLPAAIIQLSPNERPSVRGWPFFDAD